MSDELITIEVNGEPVKARPGQMLIEVTDAVDAYVPRFCYHTKLSVAANCRMCLVEIEKAPKPMPACATPVADGMKVFTRSEVAVNAQKATMEFLLINHPLDCPICDQGGECELQDLAMGFGRGVSRYTERKRVVKDKNLGPLVSTDMTRCIHCTRCVRFGEEVAGIQELGTVGRAEHMEIGTYIENSVDHELSGNIIDLCPVGALNNKPYRYSARVWEMEARPLVSPHDCVGSNLFGHVLRGTLKRVVPRDNEVVNETWISDRDRFSYEGVYSADRLTTPMIKVDGEWQSVDWSVALDVVGAALETGQEETGDVFGFLASPNVTLEEAYLLNRLARHLGSHNIDYRLRQRDFRDQEADDVWPWLGADLAAMESLDGLVVIGSHLRHEAPLLAHRVRKAALAGGTVACVNPVDYPYYFPVSQVTGELTKSLLGLVTAAAKLAAKDVPKYVAKAVDGVKATKAQREVAERLIQGGEQRLVLLGQLAQRHPAYADIRSLAAALAELVDAQLGYVSEGANAAGAAQAGLLPHRTIAGNAVKSAGLDAMGLLRSPRKVYVLTNLEPDADLADPELAAQALRAADHVIALTPYDTAALRGCCTVLLPLATYAETDGSYVNGEGRRQSFSAIANLVGGARPGWKILRVLGERLGLPECLYNSTEQVLAALDAEGSAPTLSGNYSGNFGAERAAAVDADELHVPLYQTDGIVRRAESLQQTDIACQDAGTDPASQVVNG
ncbi:MAG: NADH-quinone oxidoreductase subunit NuoG [Gammaproteobacteria bacterium]